MESKGTCRKSTQEDREEQQTKPAWRVKLNYTIREARRFLAVARRSSFRAAGADLGVTPSAISQAIRALEARVGLPLFQRTTRKVALTDAGSALLAQLTPAAKSIAEAMEAGGA